MRGAKSLLDQIYRRLVFCEFFVKGWGSPEVLKRLILFRDIISDRQACLNIVNSIPKFDLIKEETHKDVRIVECKFRSPFFECLPGIAPPEVETAYFQMVLPTKWKLTDEQRPLVIHLAGTGDHYFSRRRLLMAYPLLKHNIGSVILENPFYGFRKPSDQKRSCLHHVSDIFVMGGCLILECLAILKWAEKLGFGPLGVTGISMGGHMASLAATNYPKPIVCVPCLSWTTASSVFTEGVMAEFINWGLLYDQFKSDPKYYQQISRLARIVDHLDYYNLDEEVFHYNPRNKTLTKQINFTRFLYHPKPPEAINFMQALMDECTHLSNFTKPVETSLITVVSALHDAYVPREGLTSIDKVWPGATVKYLKAGHVSAYLMYMNFFRQCIVDAFERAKEYY